MAQPDPWEDLRLKKCTRCHLSFSTTEKALEHILTSSRHFTCEICKEWYNPKNGGEIKVEEYETADDLYAHQKKRHPTSFCDHCDKWLPVFDDHAQHLITEHCHACDVCPLKEVGVFPTAALLEEHKRSKMHLRYVTRKACQDVPVPKKAEKSPAEKKKNYPGHYGTIQISPYSTQQEVNKAAKAMRISTHPDRLKRQAGLTEEQKKAIDVHAILVGQAADILSDPHLRRKYDSEIRVEIPAARKEFRRGFGGHSGS